MARRARYRWWAACRYRFRVIRGTLAGRAGWGERDLLTRYISEERGTAPSVARRSASGRAPLGRLGVTAATPQQTMNCRVYAICPRALSAMSSVSSHYRRLSAGGGCGPVPTRHATICWAQCAFEIVDGRRVHRFPIKRRNRKQLAFHRPFEKVSTFVGDAVEQRGTQGNKSSATACHFEQIPSCDRVCCLDTNRLDSGHAKSFRGRFRRGLKWMIDRTNSGLQSNGSFASAKCGRASAWAQPPFIGIWHEASFHVRSRLGAAESHGLKVKSMPGSLSALKLHMTWFDPRSVQELLRLRRGRPV